MKNVLKWIGIVFAAFVVLGLLGVWDRDEVEESFEPLQAEHNIEEDDIEEDDIEEENESIWSEVQIIDQHNLQRGHVFVNRNDLSDEELVSFFNEHIADSNLARFTIDFSDGTGYMFHNPGSNFTYGYLNEVGAVGGSDPFEGSYLGQIEDDLVNRTYWIIPPTFDTIAEYIEWSNENDVEIRAFHANTGLPVEDLSNVEEVFVVFPFFLENDRQLFLDVK